MPQSLLGSLGPAGGPPGGGPMTQQTFRPGEAPTTQTVPAPMQPNANLGGMPGGPPQSTLGSLGPQPQANPLMDLARTNPDAAFAVLQQQQQQQANRLKFDEQRLTMGTKVAEYVGRVAQGVTSPETLEQARQELARIHPQAASQLPQTYSKEAMLPFINQAMSVKDSAQLRLETWKTQMENQRLGLQGEPAAMVSELRAMGVNPLQATPEQRRQAQTNIQQRELEQKEREGLAGAQATVQATREARQTQTLSEAFKGDTVNIYDTQTGRPLPARMTVADYEQMPQNRVTQLSEDNRKQMENLNNAMPRLAILQQHIDKVYGPGGVLERMSPEDRNIIISGVGITERWLEQATQKYPELKAAQNYIDANAESLARALSGVRGASTEGDVERAKAMLPNLTTTLQVWPPTKIGIKLPDTQAVALRTMNNLTDTLNGIGTAILGNPEYRTPLKRYPTLTQTPGMVSPGAGLPPAPSATSPGPGQGPAPALPPAPTAPAQGPLGAPPQQRYVPPAPTAPAPATRPATPTATSTPAQDEPYRQSQGQGTPPPPAPAAPAPRPTPGRQSQAPPAAGQTRVARASTRKVMELADVAEAVRQTGRSRREVEAAARAKGYTVMGSALPLPGESRMATSRTSAQDENQQLAAMVNTIAEQALRRGEDPRMAVQRWAQSVGIA